MSGTDNNNNDGNANNGTENNPATNSPAENNPTPPENNPSTTPTEAPSPASTPNEDTKVETPKDDNRAEDTTAAPDVNTDNVVTLRVLGSLKGEVTVPKGTKLSDAITKIGSATNMSMRDHNNKVVYGTAILNDNIEITTTQKASGG